MSFKRFDLTNKMVSALDEIGFYEPTPIQELVIPKAVKHKSVIGVSQTGSGKTHAFVIPILESIDMSANRIQALVVCPTRELANQLHKVFAELISHYNPEIKVMKFIGGTQRTNDVSRSKSQPQIVIATPGRIHDLFVEESTLRIEQVDWIVFDEADMIFEKDFLSVIDDILAKIQSKPQFMVFSATISKQLNAFLRKYLKNISVIETDDISRGLTTNVSHTKLKVKVNRKDQELLKLLSAINPYKMIIFASRKETVDHIHNLLVSKEIACVKLHGDMDDRKRRRVVKEIYSDKYQYIIASDIAARGIDIPMVTHVIHYDLPGDINYYIHRSGRTGRFDNTGLSIVLYDETSMEAVAKLDRLNIEITEYMIKDHDYIPKPVRAFKHQTNNDTIVIKKKKKVTPNYKKKVKTFKKR